jgi:hypothetical protein
LLQPLGATSAASRETSRAKVVGPAGRLGRSIMVSPLRARPPRVLERSFAQGNCPRPETLRPPGAPPQAPLSSSSPPSVPCPRRLI